jgi:thioredoxin-dependent peroxiredoxin
MLRVGDPLPDVMLAGDSGPLRLRDRLSNKALVVYFYPKDQTFGCTREACTFRDQYEDFVAAGADVIGVSRDDAATHASFAAQHRLPFTLLTDRDGEVAKAWGVVGMMGTPGRVTFVFDQGGVCRHRFESQIWFAKHASEALDVVKSLANRGHA